MTAKRSADEIVGDIPTYRYSDWHDIPIIIHVLFDSFAKTQNLEAFEELEEHTQSIANSNSGITPVYIGTNTWN